MPFNTFGQAWRNKAFVPDEQLHIADPSHAEPSADPNATWVAPADVENQPEFLYAMDSVVGDYVSDASGFVLDTTPVDHNDGADFGITAPGPETTSANAMVAGRSYGADRADAFQVPPFQDSSTRYISNRFEGLAGTPVNPTVAVRGLNSNPENNPDGFRRGWVEQTFVDRRMYEGERTHDRRLVTPNLAYSEIMSQNPVPGGSSAATPFATLARGITNISQRPQIRREPPSISQSLLDDGSDEPDAYDAQPSDWVTG